MARYKASLHTPMSCEAAFAYLSDFSSTAEWDPGVVEATRLEKGELHQGSGFRLRARFLGRTIPITYRIIEYEPPFAVTFLGENTTVTSRDRITFEPAGEGAWITYDAELTLKGPLRPLESLLGLAFKRVGDRALAGLRDRIGDASGKAELGAVAHGSV